MSAEKYPNIKISVDISAPDIIIKERTHLFEREILGKDTDKVREIVSRIDCFLSAANVIAFEIAIEDAYGIIPSKQTTLIRELILKIEIIYSHLNHLYKRIIPRMHGFHNYFDFVKKHEKEYQKNNEYLLRLEKVLIILSKRYPHPINTIVGGHLRIIDEDEKKEVIGTLKELIPHIVKNIDFLTKHQKSAFEIIDKHSSLWDLDKTPLISDKLKIDDEEPIAAKESYASFDIDSSAFVGAMSRLNNNKKLLSFTAEKLSKKYNLKFPLTNIYLTPVCMAIEAVHFAERFIEEIQGFHFENETRPIFEMKEGTGSACVESAKGTIYHYYEIDKMGKISKTKIILPIEENKRFLKKAVTHLPFDPDKKTRKQIMEEIDFLMEMFYI